MTNEISRIFGKIASYKFPSPIQNLINKGYISCMGIDMSEFEGVENFTTLNELFTRKLIKKRTLEGDEKDFISPCDSLISEQGRVEKGMALQIKGSSYSVDELLHVKPNKELHNGVFINFYLSPKDYHRFHVPCDMCIKKAVHIPGQLVPVNFTWLRKKEALFNENERVVLECESKEFGWFYLVFVGALNVGKIAFIFDEKIQTNVKKSEQSVYEYENLTLKKGDELGRFEMGSTIVALFETDEIALKKSNEKVRFGEIVARKIEA